MVCREDRGALIRHQPDWLLQQCALWDVGCVHYRMSSTPLREWCWRCRSFNISPQPSAISFTGCLWNNVWSSSRRYSCTRSSVRQLHRTLSTCVSPCQRVPRDAIFDRSRESCGVAMQNNKVRKAKFSCVCSANLELTTDDRSRRFYFNEQFQSTFENWTVSQSLRNWLSAYVTVINLSVNSLREHKFSYLLTLQWMKLWSTSETVSYIT